jgi:hypothetical protein
MLASFKRDNRADNGEVPINLEIIAFTFAPPNDKQDSLHAQDHLHQVSPRRYPAAEDIRIPISLAARSQRPVRAMTFDFPEWNLDESQCPSSKIGADSDDLVD